MFERIVVGTDGSDTATQALLSAAKLAAQSSAELHVVSGFHKKSGIKVDSGGAGSDGDAWMVSSTFAVEGILRDATDLVRKEKVAVTTHHEEGDPAKALITVAEQVGADLIVVGNRGMKGVKRFVLGSVPNDVAHNAPCAVLVLKTT
jgi:nucleotide-binding universal stress UspA family protein